MKCLKNQIEERSVQYNCMQNELIQFLCIHGKNIQTIEMMNMGEKRNQSKNIHTHTTCLTRQTRNFPTFSQVPKWVDFKIFLTQLIIVRSTYFL